MTKLKNDKEGKILFRNRLLEIGSFIVYAGTVVFYLLDILFFHMMDNDNASIILVQSVGALIATFSFPIIEKIFGLKILFPIRFFVMLFVFLGVFLGETCGFYYKYSFWDNILHTTSGLGIAMLGFVIINYVLRHHDFPYKITIISAVAVLISLSIGMLWEIYEFSFDHILGLNMQKLIPEVNGIFNGGNTHLPLLGSDKELADFFRQPAGYQYALNDTMNDLIDCVLGNTAFVGIILILHKYSRFKFLDQCFGELEDEDLLAPKLNK